MAFNYVTEEDVFTRYEDSKKYMLPLFEPFEEFERLARNRPHPGIARNLPKVTDGTLAASIQEQPKRVIQQLPTGKVVSTDPWLDIVGTYILEHEILRNANMVAAAIQKFWALTSKALTYGSQPVFSQFINRGEYFGTDFTLPYIKDVLLEPGKLSDRDSNFIMLRAWYQPSDIEAIIKKEDFLTRSAEERGDNYETGWNIEVLTELKDEVKQKDAQNQTPQEKMGKLNSKGYIEIVHCFQRGIGSTFISFSPALKKVVRTRTNPDPRGEIPINYMYANVDLSNPLGRGVVEIAGGMQNLLDSEVQSYQFVRTLMMAPPIEKRGSFSKSTLKYEPQAVWDLGTDPNSSANPIKLETASHAQFPINYGLLKSQILNVVGGGADNAISATSGDPQSSKTPQGVKSNEQRLGVSDNYVRRQFESCFEETCETLVNLYFAERSGTQTLKLDAATADKLRELMPNAVSEDNEIQVNYDSETPRLKFKVDPTSSSVKDTQEQLTLLAELLKTNSEDPLISWRLSQDGWKMNMGEAYHEMYELTGIKNINKIITPMSEEDKQKAASQPMPMIDKPKLTVAFDDLATNPQAQQGVLANAGIDLPIEAFQQALQTKTQLEAKPQEPTNEFDNHPFVKLMAALKIDFGQLGGDTQKWIVENIIGAPADAPMPTAIDTQVKASDAALRIAQAQHQHELATQDTHMKTSDQALKIAQAVHNEQQSKADMSLRATQQQQTADQASKSHDLAVKQANKPVAGIK